MPHTEGLTIEGIRYGFVHLLTEGEWLLSTTSLHPLASSLTPIVEADVKDIKKLCNFPPFTCTVYYGRRPTADIGRLRPTNPADHFNTMIKNSLPAGVAE